MSQIRVLCAEIRDKIAAGEVIARPASVVKELLENSLDAKAKRIEVEITKGGKDKCLVNDDGIGMDREDAQLAIQRYTTSKIGLIEDIEHIQTYGFRGEALASIVQISKFDMETSNGMIGTRILAEAGVVRDVLQSERPRGTRIKVSNIFFNLPARLKFLKSADWERRLIVNLLKTYALICPRVALCLKDGDRDVLNMPQMDSVHNRIKMLFPKGVTDHLVDVDFHLGSTRIFGVVSRPTLAVKHRLNYIYVNSRPVKYPRIYHTLIEAYQNPRFPPAFLIDISVDPQFVDANIHPTKGEVQLKDERYILDLMMQVVKRAIHLKSARVEYDIAPKVQDKGVIPTRFVQDMVMPFGEGEGSETGRVTDEFWQLHGTYILAQTKSGLIIVDQHVAHERIIYESIMQGRARSQRLLFPVTVELTPEEYRVYEKTKHMLIEMGIEFKEFSSRTLVIDSLPTDAHIGREEIAGLFSDLDALGDLIKVKSEVARVVACRGAIKAGQRLSPIEMQALIDRLFATENPYICPHGRPIVLRWTIDELAHKFGRT